MSEYIEVSETAHTSLEEAHNALCRDEMDVDDAILALVATHPHVESDVAEGDVIVVMDGSAEAKYRILD